MFVWRYVYVRMYVCMDVWMCVFTCMYACMYVCMHVCMHDTYQWHGYMLVRFHVYVCVYTHTHAHTQHTLYTRAYTHTYGQTDGHPADVWDAHASSKDSIADQTSSVNSRIQQPSRDCSINSLVENFKHQGGGQGIMLSIPPETLACYAFEVSQAWRNSGHKLMHLNQKSHGLPTYIWGLTSGPKIQHISHQHRPKFRPSESEWLTWLLNDWIKPPWASVLNDGAAKKTAFQHFIVSSLRSLAETCHGWTDHQIFFKWKEVCVPCSFSF
jgi:hypothetical protein